MKAAYRLPDASLVPAREPQGFMDDLRQAQPLMNVERMCDALAGSRRRRMEMAHESRESMRSHGDGAIRVLVVAGTRAIGKAGVTAAWLGSGGLRGQLAVWSGARAICRGWKRRKPARLGRLPGRRRVPVRRAPRDPPWPRQ